MHIIDIGVRPPYLCGVTFMLWVGECAGTAMRPLCSGMRAQVYFAKYGYIIGETVFLKHGWLFLAHLSDYVPP